MSLDSEGAGFLKSNLFLRICSAAVLAPLVLFAGWLGGWSFFALVLIVCIAVQFEWSRICRPNGSIFLLLFLAALCSLELLLIQMKLLDMAFLALAISIGSLIVFGIVRPQKQWIGVGHAYAILFGVALLLLRHDAGFGVAALIFVVGVVWGTDTFAYFVGRALGGPKLWPSISPGKTWSGAVGGAIAGLLLGYTLSHFVEGTSGIYLACVGLLLSCVSQLGDLFESWVKRRKGVKDSGQLIPGHGGMMDRVDGLIFASIAALIIALVQGQDFDRLGTLLLFGHQ
ncbi:MAG: phosphatidate cytidylyltransferase [Hyphomicrobiales bacterium]